MAKKSVEKDKSTVEPIVIENPLPPKKVKPKENDVKFIGNELVKVSDRINELELAMESLRQDIKRVMGRMGL